MDSSIQVAIISASASIIIAAVSFVISKRAERQDALQQRKIEHYRELLCALSDLAVDGIDKEAANQRFARASNTIVLIAPCNVISALMSFHNEVKFPNSRRTAEGHDQKLKDLLLEIRRDLKVSIKGEGSNFDFHLIGAAPPRT